MRKSHRVNMWSVCSNVCWCKKCQHVELLRVIKHSDDNYCCKHRLGGLEKQSRCSEKKPHFDILANEYHLVPSQTSKSWNDRVIPYMKWAALKRTMGGNEQSGCPVSYSALQSLVLDSAAKGSDCPHVLIYSLSFCKHTEERPSVQPNRSHDTFATWSGSIL